MWLKSLTFNNPIIILRLPQKSASTLLPVDSKRLYVSRPQHTIEDAAPKKTTIKVNGQSFMTDNWTNVTPKILSYLGANKYLRKNHPISIVRKRIVNYFYEVYRNSRGNPLFSVHDNLNPVVTIKQNFDKLLIPEKHVSRSKTDCYYINQNYVLRSHTTAHQADLIASGLDNFLIVGDVYRRDEIDNTHFPVFHQMDAVRLVNKKYLFENAPDLNIFDANKIDEPDVISSQLNQNCLEFAKQPCHTIEAVKLVEHEMKKTLLNLVIKLLGSIQDYRWVDAYFPFTQPSWELEIFYQDKWMEILGCGIIRHQILKKAGVHESIGYAFGLGLERLAMVLFKIPDIRLFWSNDSGFLSQFKENSTSPIVYKPISNYPQCKCDISFWLPPGVAPNSGFEPNDFYDLVRSLAGDIVEQTTLIDTFKHPKLKRWSICFRIVYRHMDRTLTQAEVNDINEKISLACVDLFKVEIR